MIKKINTTAPKPQDITSRNAREKPTLRRRLRILFADPDRYPSGDRRLNFVAAA